MLKLNIMNHSIGKRGTIMEILAVVFIVACVLVFMVWGYAKISSDEKASKKDNSEKIFFCVKCHSAFRNENEITSDKCSDCGGDVVFSGLTAVEWRGMSLEERDAYKTKFFENYLKDKLATGSEREIVKSIKQIEYDVHFIKSVVLFYVVCVLILLFIAMMLFISLKRGINSLF